MATAFAEVLVNPNTLKITIGDGAGGFQVYSIPSFGSEGVPLSSGSEFEYQTVLLSLLNAIWGQTAAAGNGVLQTPVSGSGNGTFGSV
jgi:hypothetical protein